MSSVLQALSLEDTRVEDKFLCIRKCERRSELGNGSFEEVLDVGLEAKIRVKPHA